MNNFIKGIVLIILGICIALIHLLIPEVNKVIIFLGALLVIIGISKIGDDYE